MKLKLIKPLTSAIMKQYKARDDQRIAYYSLQFSSLHSQCILHPVFFWFGA